jgi:hypothetical protein
LSAASTPREATAAFHDWHKLVKHPKTCEVCGAETLPDEPPIHNRTCSQRVPSHVCLCNTTEEGWRPCPPSLCERPDHDHATGEDVYDRMGRYHAALYRIAAGRRPDGTYNLSREACEQIAKEALDG